MKARGWAEGWHSLSPCLPLPCSQSQWAAAWLQGTGVSVSTSRRALSFPQSSLLSLALITKCFQSHHPPTPLVTATLLWAAERYSTSVCSAQGGVDVIPVFFPWGKKEKDIPLTLERSAVAWLARGWSALSLLWEGAKLPVAVYKGREKTMSLPGT